MASIYESQGPQVTLTGPRTQGGFQPGQAYDASSFMLRQSERDLATLGMNLGYAQQDYSWNVLNVFEQHKSANIQAAAQRRPSPSVSGLLLGLGGAALGGVSSYASLKAPKATAEVPAPVPGK